MTLPAGLRRWQREALETYEAAQPEDFLVSATPGAGKTTFALTLADAAHGAGKVVDRVIVVAPTDHLRTQWADAAADVGLVLDPTLKNSDGPVRAGLRRLRDDVRAGGRRTRCCTGRAPRTRARW